MFELRMEITLQLCLFFFARHCDVLILRYNYVIYLFDAVTLELRLEITLQLRFVSARHCNVFFVTSQLRYLFVRCSYVF